QDEKLQEEADGQESILSKLLGDYDKVKALSEGSDCRCKCVVRPLSKSACRRIEEGNASAQDFYTVETITSGPHCKCACLAPPSAVNPCEGEYRLQKLREAGNENVKLSTILELLEGSFYGMDLLKLHSVTYKLLDRMDRVEKCTRVTETMWTLNAPWEQSRDEVRLEMKEQGTGNGTRAELPLFLLVPAALTRAKAPVSSQPEKYEKFAGDDPPRLQKDGSVQIFKGAPLTGPRTTINKAAPRMSRTGSNGMIIRGMTFYKSEPDLMVADDGEPGENFFEYEGFSGDNAINLFIEENLLQPRAPHPRTRKKLTRLQTGTSLGDSITESPVTSLPITTPSPTTTALLPTTTSPLATTHLPTTITPSPNTTTTPLPTTSSPLATTHLPTSTKPLPITTKPLPPLPTTTTPLPTTTTPLPTTTSPLATTHLPTTTKLLPITTTPLPTITTLLAKEESVPPRKRGECKDTLATISEPVTHNTYGRNEGAWMKDPLSGNDKIYVTNFYYGNNLLEFRNLEVFKTGRFTNSYKLPYNWIGTGHVVYNGAFYYSRAFSRDIIKFDLRHRQVAAWTMLHDALIEESSSPWEWRSQSSVTFAVDESGLWIVYPALDEERFMQEMIVLSRLNPTDLSMQPETTWRTGLKRNRYGNCFIVCGVLYAVDSYNEKDAKLEYAFDTHTNTQMIPRMPFTNNYTYTTQIDYNPKEGVLYAWDNGHQVTYNIKFAY
uniref:Olfactomedin-like 2Ba n=2 Tax=Tetraodon nigroviridis TaxID=99883 RepID=H3CZB4_TETNG